jgi:hypothetical protein
VRVVVVPASFVSADWHTPTVCARHDEPAAGHRRVKFRSLVPGWTFLFLPLPLLLVIVAFGVQRRVTAPAWPFCARCGRMRAWGRGFALGVLAIAVGFVAYAFVHGHGDAGDSDAAALLIGLILLVLGEVAFVRSSLGRIANGYVTSDGSALEFRKPRPLFTEQVAQAKDAAARHQAQQHHLPDPA